MVKVRVAGHDRWVGAAKARRVRPCNSNEGGALVEAFMEATQLFSDLLLSHLPTKPQMAKGEWACLIAASFTRQNGQAQVLASIISV